ncbi:DUF4410 domain-containing protein [Acidisoma cellulosilytica]|uniref:DUF4410 domain-containing protein n=1 Tax=Acidisoma cellulosilyticum TaxID=2802395 RepID=A0A964E4N9_9PROT|nr:DUF4410 domain-containing protein [Acidisoma cellulosilyticum]MCB8881895.1 DUF4410 domain-containing protein [Acidisoma cellulosilyticum]
MQDSLPKTMPAALKRKPGRAALAGLSLFLLSSCAGAHVSNIASVSTTTPAPSEILVAVDTAPMPNADQTRAAAAVAPQLQAAVVRRLGKAHIAAIPYTAGSARPGAAVLHVSIQQADPGSRAERFLIGFGMGSAKLEARADLETTLPSAHSSLTAFDTASDTGIKPGLILPGGIALATGNLIHLAIGGGIDVVTNLNGGLSKPTNSTATAIVKQLHRYYRSAGWVWPTDEES